MSWDKNRQGLLMNADGLTVRAFIEAVSRDAGALTVRMHGDRESEPRRFVFLLKCSENNGKWRCKP
jgi:hypothetical protein